MPKLVDILCYVKLIPVFQLEDDLIATPGYVSTIRTFALQQTENRWMMLEFSSLGFIGIFTVVLSLCCYCSNDYVLCSSIYCLLHQVNVNQHTQSFNQNMNNFLFGRILYVYRKVISCEWFTDDCGILPNVPQRQASWLAAWSHTVGKSLQSG